MHYLVITRLFYALILLSLGLYACKRPNDSVCPDKQDLGQQYWSAETQEWFPEQYMLHFTDLHLVSDNGDTVQLKMYQNALYDGEFELNYVPCENGENSTEVRFAERRYEGIYLLQDSLSVTVNMGVSNEKLAGWDFTEPDFYDWISVSVHSIHNGHLYKLGRVKILTDIKNSELEDIDPAADYFKFHENLQFMGQSYQDIYSDPWPYTPNADTNIYFKKEVGLIGFTDRYGVNWKVVF